MASPTVHLIIPLWWATCLTPCQGRGTCDPQAGSLPPGALSLIGEPGELSVMSRDNPACWCADTLERILPQTLKGILLASPWLVNINDRTPFPLPSGQPRAL